MIRRSSTPVLTAALAALCIVPAACSDDADDQATSPPSTSESSPSGGGPIADYSIVGETHLYGPMVVVEVPVGFQARESFIWTDAGEGRGFGRSFGQLTYWTATRVLADPCNVDTPSPPLGPTVEDLAAALDAQRRTTTTKPVPVELDGHRGLYLELRSPTQLDYAACVPERGMLIWESGEPGDGRGLEAPSTDRYWIMDVGGKRVVIAALTIRRADSETIELIEGVAKATTFVLPA